MFIFIFISSLYDSMIIGKVLTVARCGIQMSLQTPSLVLILPSTERQLQLKIKKFFTEMQKLKTNILF